MASLFERLDEEEAIVRGELDALREKLAAGEERLARLTITRETARQLLGDDPQLPGLAAAAPVPAATGGATGAPGPVPAGQFARLAALEPRFAADRPAAASLTVSAGSAAAGPQRVEWAVGVERILAVLGTSGRVMRTREIAAAIGEDTTQVTRVETTRSRLKRLVKAGKVTEAQPGFFRIAAVAPAGGEVPEVR